VTQSARAAGHRPYQPRTGADKIGVAELADAVAQLDGPDLDGALRHRIVPFDMGPGKPVGYVVDSAIGLAHARSTGLHIISAVPPGWMRQALMRAAGPAILEHACNGLARRMPSLSASRRLTAGQAAALVLAPVAVAALAFTGEWFATVLVLFFAILFLSQAALRFSSIGRHAPATGLKLADLDDDELPVYSVLVPLFRETDIVDQLLQALKLIDYPALCIKRTNACRMVRLCNDNLPTCHLYG